MTYTGKCPHCGNIVSSGHGIPIKSIETPIKTCKRCHRTYVNNNMYEWAVLKGIYRLYYYFFANNRWIGYLLLPLFAAGTNSDAIGYLILALLGSIAWAGLCYIWVKFRKQDDFDNSHQRCLQPGYVDTLLKVYDKVDVKKCTYYQQEIIKRQEVKAQHERDAVKAKQQAFLQELNQHCKNCGKKLNVLQVICDNCGEKRS